MEAGLRRARGSPSAPLGGPMAGAGQGRKAFSSLARGGWVSAGLSLPSGTLWGPKPLPPPISIFRLQGQGSRIVAQGVRQGKAQDKREALCSAPSPSSMLVPTDGKGAGD